MKSKAKEIRDRYLILKSYKKVAAEYGISFSYARNIILGHRFPEEGGNIGVLKGKGSRIDEPTIISIREMAMDKIRYKVIAEKFNVGIKEVSKAVTGKTYKKYGGPILEPFAGRRKFSIEVEAIIISLKEENTIQQIADILYEEYDIDAAESTIGNCLRRVREKV